MDEFEWDPRKASANRRKPGIDFADATSVFEDEQALTVGDEISAVDEPRYLTLGRDALARVLVVTYTRRNDQIRVISARRATPGERRQYREGRTPRPSGSSRPGWKRSPGWRSGSPRSRSGPPERAARG